MNIHQIKTTAFCLLLVMLVSCKSTQDFISSVESKVQECSGDWTDCLTPDSQQTSNTTAAKSEQSRKTKPAAQTQPKGLRQQSANTNVSPQKLSQAQKKLHAQAPHLIYTIDYDLNGIKKSISFLQYEGEVLGFERSKYFLGVPPSVVENAKGSGPYAYLNTATVHEPTNNFTYMNLLRYREVRPLIDIQDHRSNAHLQFVDHTRLPVGSTKREEAHTQKEFAKLIDLLARPILGPRGYQNFKCARDPQTRKCDDSQFAFLERYQQLIDKIIPALDAVVSDKIFGQDALFVADVNISDYQIQAKGFLLRPALTYSNQAFRTLLSGNYYKETNAFLMPVAMSEARILAKEKSTMNAYFLYSVSFQFGATDQPKTALNILTPEYATATITTRDIVIYGAPNKTKQLTTISL